MSASAKPKRESVTFTAEQLEDRLARRYRTPDSEILFGVRNDAGFSADRTADAIAIGLWPSTGCALEGFEVKVSRGDWTRELKSGGKSEAFKVYMDFWWLVAPRDVVTDDELPPDWGLLVPHGDTLKVARQAKRNPTPLPMPRGMLAALIKRASTAEARKAALQERYRAGLEEGKKWAAPAESFASQEYRDLKAAVERFHQATGIDPRYYAQHEELRAAAAIVRLGDQWGIQRRVRDAARDARAAADTLATIAAEIGSVPPASSAPPASGATPPASRCPRCDVLLERIGDNEEQCPRCGGRLTELTAPASGATP